MKVKRELKKIITILISIVMVLGCGVVAQAASYTPAYEYDGLSANVKSNCVAFARYKVPSLPYGLTSLDDKRAIINSYTPAVGAIAITNGNNPQYGHVAYVEAVNGNTITTLNGGYEDGSHIYRITSTPSEQGVIGYWNPNGGGSVTVSLTWENDNCQPDASNVYVYTEAHTNISGSFSEAGITVWNEAGNVVASKSEAPGITGTRLNIWYNITNDTGVTLASGSNYTYQFYTVFNGTRYNSPVKSFRTAGQADNSWTQSLTISDWTYGNTGSLPKATAKYGTPTFTYSTSKDGIYTTTVPTNAGTYYVKATVTATEQYKGLEAIKEFHINKANPEYTIPEGLTIVYGERLESIELPDGFTWYDSSELSGPAGERTAEIYYTPADTDNYNSVENIEVAIIVQPKDLSGLKLIGIDKNTDLSKYEIKDGDVTLIMDTDYKISSETVGDTVTVTVTFIGNYTGKTQASYSLKEASVSNNNTSGKMSSQKSNTQKSTTPKTSDTASIITWTLLLIIAVGAICLTTLRKRNFKK